MQKLLECTSEAEDEYMEAPLSPEKCQKRRKKIEQRGKSGVWCEETQTWVPYEPKKSKWYLDYVLSNKYEIIPRLKRKFRNRFRLPREKFRELVTMAVENNWFPTYGKKDATGKEGVPLELLILGSLRYLGRGWTFDDLEEATNIGLTTHRQFFHKFIKVGATELFKMWVKMPETEDEILDSMHEYHEAGFTGCIGSSDATHIIMEKCNARLKNHNSGGKDSHTTRVFNIVVNHRRKILNTTPGFPGRWNDKTIVLFDGMLRSMNEGKIYQNIEYDLWTNGKYQKFRGAYVMVDNGYLNWSCTVPPIKESTNMDEIRWSRWLESMRKDVECTFGILKGRWRVLKTGIRLHSFEAVDNIWKTCCAFHNWLLDIDGLNAEWENGIPSDFEGELGLHDENDAHYTVPLILARVGSSNVKDRMTTIFGDRAFDGSGLGIGGTRFSEINDQDYDNDNDEDDDDHYVHNDQDLNEDPNGSVVARNVPIRIVKNMRLKSFRRVLIEHFSKLWRERKVVWPSRTGKVEWTLMTRN